MTRPGPVITVGIINLQPSAVPCVILPAGLQTYCLARKWLKGTTAGWTRGGTLALSGSRLLRQLMGWAPGGALLKKPICNFSPVVLSGVWKLPTKLRFELVHKSRKIGLALRLSKPTPHLSSFGCGPGGLYPVVRGTAVVHDLIADLPGF